MYFDAFFENNDSKYPDMLVTKHLQEIHCCTCSDQLGRLTCTGCFAVRYCSEQCRRIQWNNHKDVCKWIRQSREIAIAAVASERSRKKDESWARETLISAFVKCGQVNRSALAFRLPAENVEIFDKPRQNYKQMGGCSQLEEWITKFVIIT